MPVPSPRSPSSSQEPLKNPRASARGFLFYSLTMNFGRLNYKMVALIGGIVTVNVAIVAGAWMSTNSASESIASISPSVSPTTPLSVDTPSPAIEIPKPKNPETPDFAKLMNRYNDSELWAVRSSGAFLSGWREELDYTRWSDEIVVETCSLDVFKGWDNAMELSREFHFDDPDSMRSETGSYKGFYLVLRWNPTNNDGNETCLEDFRAMRGVG